MMVLLPAHTTLLLLLFPSFLGAVNPGCTLVFQEDIKCRKELKPTETPGCEADCQTMSVDDCREEEPEECTTQLDTVCDATEEAAEQRSTASASKVKAVLAKAGIDAEIAKSSEELDSNRKKRSPFLPGLPFLPGRGPFPLPSLLPSLGSGLLLPTLPLFKLLKLKFFLKKAGIATAIAVPIAIGVGKKKHKGQEGETCFEIPRTVCKAASHYKEPKAASHYKEPNHYSKREADYSTEHSNCHTTVQTVCGVNASEQYRRKRSLGAGCRVVPVSQHCFKQEPRQVCRKIEKEICSELPKGCYKETEVCGPEKVLIEVCS